MGGSGLCPDPPTRSELTLNKTVTAGGTVTGWCGHSSGQGVANGGATFAWISAGSFLILTGIWWASATDGQDLRQS